MTYAHGFLAVPTTWLELEPEAYGASPKASPQEMQQWMSGVPEIYDRLAHGTTDAEFQRMYEHPVDKHERMLGETYAQLFARSPSAQPIKADFIEGRGLVVQAGQHRVLAAQARGVPLVPVQVSTPDEATYVRIRAACEDHTTREFPDLAHLVDVHREYDRQMNPDRSPIRSPERHPGIERLEPVREERFRYPERER